MMDTNLNGFTVTAVLYGEHPSLARRCLGTIAMDADPNLCRSVRVGLNAVGPISRSHALTALRHLPESVQVLVYDCGEHNRLKYPLLRKMLYDPKHPVFTPYIM